MKLRTIIWLVVLAIIMALTTNCTKREEPQSFNLVGRDTYVDDNGRVALPQLEAIIEKDGKYYAVSSKGRRQLKGKELKRHLEWLKKQN